MNTPSHTNTPGRITSNTAATLVALLAGLLQALGASAASLVGPALSQPAASDRFLLIQRTRPAEEVTLVEITDTLVRVRDRSGSMRSIDRRECVAAIALDVRVTPGSEGLLVLTDGQRLPGRARPGSTDGEGVLTWQHPWFESLRIPAQRLAWARLTPNAPEPPAGDADVLLLTNGDRMEGLIESFGDEITLDREGVSAAVPLTRVSAFRLLNPRRNPAPDTPRLWLRNDTVVDVEGLRLAEDGYLRFMLPLNSSAADEKNYRLAFVAGILFQSGALTPLGSMTPHDVEGPRSRYLITPPRVSDAPAALDLKTVEYAGPMQARYTLPAGSMRFVAVARLRDDAGAWADCEVVVRDDDREVFRARLSAATRSVAVNADLSGAELSIEVTEGAHGPIQDQVIFEQPMIIRR